MAARDPQRRQYQDLWASVIPFTATIDVASLVDGAGSTEVVTVTGAALGDFVRVTWVLDLEDITVTAYVQAADTVEIRVQNESGGVVDLASATVYGLVEQPSNLITTA